MLRAVMFVLYLSGTDAPDYRHRAESERLLQTWVFTADRTMPEPPNLSPEQRLTWRRIQTRYRNVEPPGVECFSETEWWDLYTRVTGITKDDIGWFFGVMPSPDDLESMRRLWVEDQFDRGLTRTEVICLCQELRNQLTHP